MGDSARLWLRLLLIVVVSLGVKMIFDLLQVKKRVSNYFDYGSFVVFYQPRVEAIEVQAVRPEAGAVTQVSCRVTLDRSYRVVSFPYELKDGEAELEVYAGHVEAGPRREPTERGGRVYELSFPINPPTKLRQLRINGGEAVLVEVQECPY